MGKDPDDLRYELGRVAELKKTASLPSKLTLTLTWAPRPYLPNPRETGEVIARQLHAIGIEVQVIQSSNRDDFFQRMKHGTFELCLAGWIADTADPADFYDALLHSDSIPGGPKMSATANNMSRYRSAEMDAALKAFRGDPSAASRNAVTNLLSRDAPLLPLIYGQAVAIYRRGIVGFRPSPLGRSTLSQLQFPPDRPTIGRR